MVGEEKSRVASSSNTGDGIFQALKLGLNKILRSSKSLISRVISGELATPRCAQGAAWEHFVRVRSVWV